MKYLVTFNFLNPYTATIYHLLGSELHILADLHILGVDLRDEKTNKHTYIHTQRAGKDIKDQ